ncbi:hypothetical protein R1sor_020260 [Riccia sorocarpa]|uniref:Reverse transcriptase domain-containing protein n=1 Tax=Riccia sorocarpa TaxID=122646 RepID=A0ABD3IEU1_9MARC
MQLLRKEERAGNLIGINIPGGRPLLDRLFADDSGVSITATETNFSNLKHTIARFEKFSGARLNLTKSAVIPIALSGVPQWLTDSGCKIVQTDPRSRTYLAPMVEVPMGGAGGRQKPTMVMEVTETSTIHRGTSSEMPSFGRNLPEVWQWRRNGNTPSLDLHGSENYLDQAETSLTRDGTLYRTTNNTHRLDRRSTNHTKRQLGRASAPGKRYLSNLEG